MEIQYILNAAHQGTMLTITKQSQQVFILTIFFPHIYFCPQIIVHPTPKQKKNREEKSRIISSSRLQNGEERIIFPPMSKLNCRTLLGLYIILLLASAIKVKRKEPPWHPWFTISEKEGGKKKKNPTDSSILLSQFSINFWVLLFS